jgi:hypothetical protein
MTKIDKFAIGTILLAMVYFGSHVIASILAGRL